MRKIESYLCGSWNFQNGKTKILNHAIEAIPVAEVTLEKPHSEEIIHYAKKQASGVLAKMTFHERARMLKSLALYLMDRRDLFYQESVKTGATKLDSWIDIEGGIGTLFAFSSKGRREFPNTPFYQEGKYEQLSKNGQFGAVHILTPKEGVAVHINAFNFPIWGMLEKIAANLLAGVPAIVKPATQTCYLTECMVREIVKSEILPKGSLQLICGPVGDLLDHLFEQDVLTFTGSAQTALLLKGHKNLLSKNIPFNVEADSLNFCMLGPDVKKEDPEFELFIKEVTKEVTVKAGQKCTAIRRVLVPENMVEAVSLALKEKFSKTVVGDPRVEGVRMGALAGHDQLKDVTQNLNLLRESCQTLLAPVENNWIGDKASKGAFLSPVLLLSKNPLENLAPHNIEVFGPVTTIMPYKNLDEAQAIIKLGRGSLVGSVVTHSKEVAITMSLGVANFHGRLLILSRECAKDSTGHGSPLPQLVHGGPGRAGGGEEMGGARGVKHYMQRTAIQGHPTFLSHITQVHQVGAQLTESSTHPFKKYFEELEIGETLTTHKRTVTETDIVNFACLTGDHFYAHMDETSLEGSLFEKRVAHGYLLMGMAAGLFVDPKRGPVLANYGVDEFRFVKPVYVGTTIGVRLTVQQKIAQDRRPDDTVSKGIVKWQVDLYDQIGETVAIGTILTLVQRKND